MASKTKKLAKKARRRKVIMATPKIKAAAIRAAKRAAKGAPIGKASGAVRPRRKPDDRLVLHGLHLSLPSCKVGLMLTMADLPFDYRHVDLMAGAHKTPEFVALNRFGQVPVLQHGGRTLSQSNTILRYLANLSGKFGGRGESDMWRIAEWLNWDLDVAAPGLGTSRAMARFFPDTPAEVKAHMRRRGELALATLDRHLGTSKYMVGAQPTIADIAIFPWVATADEGGFDVSAHPNVRDWAVRFLKLPGAAHPYATMPKEDRVTNARGGR